jgi:oxygen-independent coproporphyrinogen-3 oxidase
MWSYHPDLLARAVPRYTSYPTAAEFSDLVGRCEQEAALKRIGDGASVSLYIHIPYCQEICWYCGCNTGAANRGARLAAYLEALHREITLIGHRLEGHPNITRIAFGGGSPNALHPVSFVRLLDTVVTAFCATTAKVSIELDPRVLNQAWFEVIARTGVENASLGCQTFAPHVQAAIGRVQPLDMIERSVRSLRAAGVKSLNFDLMYGLPGQTRDDLIATLDETVRLGADRIALFGYAHIPSVINRQRRINAGLLPDATERFEHAALGHMYLKNNGYKAVGFDHFALPGDPLATAARDGRLKRNFQGFTDDEAGIVLGLGASAISQFPDLIIQNEKRPGRYRMLATADNLVGQRGVVRSIDDQRRGKIIEQLLCFGKAKIPEDLLYGAHAGLQSFLALNLAGFYSDHLEIKPSGLPYARAIASVFDRFRENSVGIFSNAV